MQEKNFSQNENVQDIQSYYRKTENIKQDFLDACETFKAGPMLIKALQEKNIWLSLETISEDGRSKAIKLFPMTENELLSTSKKECENWSLPQLVLSRFYTKGKSLELQGEAYENTFGEKFDLSKYQLSLNNKNDIQRINVFLSSDFLPIFLRQNEFINDLKKILEIEKMKTIENKNLEDDENGITPLLIPVMNRLFEKKQEDEKQIISGTEAAFKEKWENKMQLFGVTERGNRLQLFPPLSQELINSYQSIFLSGSTSNNFLEKKEDSFSGNISFESLNHLLKKPLIRNEIQNNPFSLNSPIAIQDNIEEYIQIRQQILYKQQFDLEKQKQKEKEKSSVPTPQGQKKNKPQFGYL